MKLMAKVTLKINEQPFDSPNEQPHIDPSSSGFTLIDIEKVPADIA